MRIMHTNFAMENKTILNAEILKLKIYPPHSPE